MIIDAEEDRLFVISDLHLGNPSSTARTRLVEFLDYARITGTSVCINGDGFEMLQTSFSRLASDAVPVLNALRRLMREGNRVYYLVGNHDISLEHFLEDWLFTQIAPFLNLRSGDSRIRIEHGHLYDPWFVRYPKSYEAGRAPARARAARASRRVLGVREGRRCGRRRVRKGDPPDEVAAEMLLSRGLRHRDLRSHAQRRATCSSPNGPLRQLGQLAAGQQLRRDRQRQGRAEEVGELAAPDVECRAEASSLAEGAVLGELRQPLLHLFRARVVGPLPRQRRERVAVEVARDAAPCGRAPSRRPARGASSSSATCFSSRSLNSGSTSFAEQLERLHDVLVPVLAGLHARRSPGRRRHPRSG